MIYTCPNDPTHESDNPDNCSVCGAGISRSPAPEAVSAPEPISVAARGNAVLVGDEMYPESDSSSVLTATSTRDTEFVPAGPAPAKFELVVSVDPTIYVRPTPPTPCPTGQPDKTFPLTKPVNMIGRRSERRGILPDIFLSDPAVSHKHALLMCEPDGSLVLEDAGSANGTQLNGKYVPSGMRISLCAGDQIIVGCWTRITVRTVAE
jgi:pSer/pThr/pTyr-binding forkhead associated (FHA) protein